jgi:hypothetical protein
MPDLEIHVHRAELDLDPGTDPRAPGGAVTIALCGSVNHPPPCRWPNNNELDGGQLAGDASPARFRTVYVAPPEDLEEVRARIESALRDHAGWRALSVTADAPTKDERVLGERLIRGLRRRQP